MFPIIKYGEVVVSDSHKLGWAGLVVRETAQQGGGSVNLAKNLFICVCMAVIATSLGYSVWANLGLNGFEAMMIGLGVLVLQLIGYLFVWKAIIYRALISRIHDLALAEADNANGVERISNELSGSRKTLKSNVRAEMEPLARELEVIGSLIKQLAENNSELDRRIQELEARPISAPAPAAPPRQVAKPARKANPARKQPQAETTTNAKETVEWLDDAATADTAEDEALNAEFQNTSVMSALKDAVDNNNVDLFLQPIVTLPQRKPKFYEALSRIRNSDGDLIRPADFLKSAEKSGAMPIIDKMLLVRAIQVLRRLMSRKSDAVVVCNISATSLADSSFFNDFKKLLQARKDLADHLIFEFDQITASNFGPLEEESLRTLKSLGFHFAIDNVTDLSMDFRNFVQLGVHYIKVSAGTLLAARETGINDIHAHDFPRYLSRNGIQLIVDHIETEGQVVELLDFDISLGQGFLFAGPKEVKPDTVQNQQRRASDQRLAS